MAGVIVLGHWDKGTASHALSGWDNRVDLLQMWPEQQLLDLQQLYASWRFFDFTQTEEFRTRGADTFDLKKAPRPGHPLKKWKRGGETVQWQKIYGIPISGGGYFTRPSPWYSDHVNVPSCLSSDELVVDGQLMLGKDLSGGGLQWLRYMLTNTAWSKETVKWPYRPWDYDPVVYADDLFLSNGKINFLELPEMHFYDFCVQDEKCSSRIAGVRDLLPRLPPSKGSGTGALVDWLRAVVVTHDADIFTGGFGSFSGVNFHVTKSPMSQAFKSMKTIPFTVRLPSCKDADTALGAYMKRNATTLSRKMNETVFQHMCRGKWVLPPGIPDNNNIRSCEGPSLMAACGAPPIDKPIERGNNGAFTHMKPGCSASTKVWNSTELAAASYACRLRFLTGQDKVNFESAKSFFTSWGWLPLFKAQVDRNCDSSVKVSDCNLQRCSLPQWLRVSPLAARQTYVATVGAVSSGYKTMHTRRGGLDPDFTRRLPAVIAVSGQTFVYFTTMNTVNEIDMSQTVPCFTIKKCLGAAFRQWAIPWSTGLHKCLQHLRPHLGPSAGLPQSQSTVLRLKAQHAAKGGEVSWPFRVHAGARCIWGVYRVSGHGRYAGQVQPGSVRC